MNGRSRFPKNSTLDKFDYSELSYKFLFTTKSLILAQDER